MTSNEMGATLGLSAHTVDWYMNGIQDKLQRQEPPPRGGDRLPAGSDFLSRHLALESPSLISRNCTASQRG
jgi:hypothetical protein